MASIILAIDTTSERGSLAVTDGPNLLEEVALQSTDGYAHVLFHEIEQLLARHSLTVADVACFAVASGPGAFTGVRVGLTAAKGLAEASGRKVVAVSNLQALAIFGNAALRAPMIDARRGDIFGAVYDSNLAIVQEEVVMPFEAWKAGLPKGAEIIQREAAARGLASAIARIGYKQFEQGFAQDPAEIDANYVRRSDAEVMWRDLRAK